MIRFLNIWECGLKHCESIALHISRLSGKTRCEEISVINEFPVDSIVNKDDNLIPFSSKARFTVKGPV